jgi:hypothetical protein
MDKLHVPTKWNGVGGEIIVVILHSLLAIVSQSGVLRVLDASSVIRRVKSALNLLAHPSLCATVSNCQSSSHVVIISLRDKVELVTAVLCLMRANETVG